MSFLHSIQKLRAHHVRSSPPSLAHTRENVLFGIILISAAVGFIAYIPSLIGAISIGYYDTALIDTMFYVWILVLLFNPKLSYTQRVIGFVAPIWLLSVYLILRFGIEGAGFLWLLVAPVMTGILLGLKEGLVTLLLTVAMLFGIGVAMSAFGLIPNLFGGHPILFWSVMSGNTIVLTILLMVSASIMIDSLSRTIERLNSNIKELADTKDATIETVANLAECKDTETGHHIERTREYVRIIAQTLKMHGKYTKVLTEEYITLLYKSAPLHDIGKIGIPDSILLKEGPLSFEEMEIMKTHTTIGRDALLRSEHKLGSNTFLRLAAEIAYSHQERWDGSGYPLGLKGEEIPLSGRIMAVADVYDALRSERPYKAALSHEKAVSYLRKQSGILFDPKIIALLPEFEKRFEAVYETMHSAKRCSIEFIETIEAEEGNQ